MKLSKYAAMTATAILAALLLTPATAQLNTPSPSSAAVYFINLKDGDTVTSPFKVQFGLTGMGVAPVGVEKDNTGHHHLIIDAKLSPEELKAPIAADAQHVHYGAGQTEAMVTLPPGAAHLAARAWQLVAHSAQPAGHVAGHHHYGEVRP
jgi:hypothetical protein